MGAVVGIKSAVRRRPLVVQQVLRIIATKVSVEPDERVEIGDAEAERLFAIALREWDGWLEKAREITEISEEHFAEIVIARLRQDPVHGWDRILRGRAN